MNNWKEYTGSDEQIAELWKADDGFIARFTDGSESQPIWATPHMTLNTVTHYWIIPDDPLREMKIRQSQTGQPVWIKHRTHWDKRINAIQIDCTTTPNWNIPGAEYSFTSFDEGK